MESSGILVDSSLIIDYFRKNKKEKTQLYRLFEIDKRLYISALTVYELLCGAKTPLLYRDTEKILTLFDILEFGTIEASKAAKLYLNLKKENKVVGIIDILIAATANIHKLKIATLNKEHFERIKFVKLFDLPS